MEFSKKLCKLLALTETQGAQLSKSILLDPSQISRMKTGTRGRPGSRETLRRMADFFARHCGSEYRLSALAELTGDSRIQTQRSEKMSADIIYNWLLSDDGDEPGERGGAAPHRAASFGIESTAEHSPEKAESSALTAYYDNSGKRRAVLDLLDMAADGGKPCEIYLFTDENMDWAYENVGYINELTRRIDTLARLDCRFYRVEPPAQDMETMLRSIDRWLPAYMTGTIRQYYYPRLRDELHRRTLFVIPGRAAVFSRSLSGQKHSRFTILCTDEGMVDICHQEVQDIMALCRPMMRVYTGEESVEIHSSLANMAAMPANGIYKTGSLSVPTLPIEVMERVSRESGTTLAEQMLNNCRQRAELRRSSLKEHHVDDIMTLADPALVRAGRVPIPGTVQLPGGVVFYKPSEYKLHLQRITEAMNEFENYRVILTENPVWKDITIYGKGDDTVLMVKDKYPYAVFEITENRLAASFCGFLRQIVEHERARMGQEGTLRKLREAMAQL